MEEKIKKEKLSHFFEYLQHLSGRHDKNLTSKLCGLLEELNFIVTADASQILLLNEENKLVTVVSRNLDKATRDLQYKLGEGVVGTAVKDASEKNQIYFTGNIKQGSWNKPVRAVYGNVGSFKNMYSFLISAFEDGAIVLSSEREDWFSKIDRESMEFVLPFLSVFIKNSLKDRNHALDIVMGVYRELEAKHREYRGHAERVQKYAVDLFNILKNDKYIEIMERYEEAGVEMFEQRLNKGAFLHDIGKIRFQDGLLASSKTFSVERNPFREHCIFGYNILRDHGIIDPVFLDAALHHHQNYKGNGYPAIDQGHKIEPLQGRDIPFVARILRVVDVYDALRSERPYRKAFSKEKTIKMMDLEKEKFDPYIYGKFLNYIIEKGK